MGAAPRLVRAVRALRCWDWRFSISGVCSLAGFGLPVGRNLSLGAGFELGTLRLAGFG